MAKKPIINIIQESRPYVLWRRVSTKEQGRSELGLEAQLAIAQAFMGKGPLKVFTDVHTGTKLKECGALWKAIDFCKENGCVLTIAKFDRCRNVQEALEILDHIGERNLVFCDLPTTDRFVLTIMFAVAEKQAAMGKINTRIALAERKKQIERDGGFFSKNGNWCTHLGRKKGCDPKEGYTAAGVKMTADADAWRETSPLFSWVSIQILKHRRRVDIVAEARQMYEKNPEIYCTRQGKPLSKGILSKWVREIEKSM